MITYYNHHGNKVAVFEERKGLHREHCLCYHCKLFHPNKNNNCKIAQKVYENCIRFGIVTPMYECPKYKGDVKMGPTKAPAQIKGIETCQKDISEFQNLTNELAMLVSALRNNITKLEEKLIPITTASTPTCEKKCDRTSGSTQINEFLIQQIEVLRICDSNVVELNSRINI